ncbi:hypothetical protein DMB42_49550 [Nonomuraea sp. WAC 01424]|nr:hypothetical protein DMB42_49550 [Nonomuraea sp. WAC 01424]
MSGRGHHAAVPGGDRAGRAPVLLGAEPEEDLAHGLGRAALLGRDGRHVLPCGRPLRRRGGRVRPGGGARRGGRGGLRARRGGAVVVGLLEPVGPPVVGDLLHVGGRPGQGDAVDLAGRCGVRDPREGRQQQQRGAQGGRRQLPGPGDHEMPFLGS